MSKGAYKPRGDSLAARVIAFFQANPDEELYPSDIAAKWAVNSQNVFNLMKPALNAGFVTRTADEAGQHYYTAGPHLHEAPAAKPAQAPAPQALSATLESAPDRIVVEIHLHFHTAEA